MPQVLEELNQRSTVSQMLCSRHAFLSGKFQGLEVWEKGTKHRVPVSEGSPKDFERKTRGSRGFTVWSIRDRV